MARSGSRKQALSKPRATVVARVETENEQEQETTTETDQTTADFHALRQLSRQGGPLQPNQIMAAQRIYGNRAVERLISTRQNRTSKRAIQRHPGHDNEQVARQTGEVQRSDDGNPVAPSDQGPGGEHPVLSQGTGPQNKIAVQELQQKLNSVSAADPPLVVDGIFGPLTLKAVKNFQSTNKVTINGKEEQLKADGIVGPKTWTALDVKGSSNVGQIRNTWTESDIGGETYGLTSSYSWKITDSAVEVTVKFHFTGGGAQRATIINNAFNGIKRVWNSFKIKKEGAEEALDLVFIPAEAPAGTDVSTVSLVAKNGRSDAGTWYLSDPDLNSKTAPHEFGHMIGLEDEYQRSHTDYKRLTGDEPPTGALATPEQIAKAPAIATSLHTALHPPGNVKARAKAAYENVITANGLTPGVLAHSHIMPSYQAQFGVSVTQDIHDQLSVDNADTLQVNLTSGNRPLDSVRTWIAEPFTYTSTSVMGDMSSVVPNSDNSHDHGVEPRHVRQFAGFVQKLKGGKWKAVLK
jgi:hypothetical protein